MTHRRNFWLLLLASAALLTPSFVMLGFAQGSGRLLGVVRAASGTPVAGVSIIATNQVTGKWKRVRSGGDGRYSFSLPAGAYRVRVGAPQVAKFDKDKNYGDFTIARGDALENVIVEAGKETVIDIPLDQVEIKVIPAAPGDQPTGHAGAETVPSEPPTSPDRREARDRWRIGFPEYDRYGDKAARGRDIPFKRGRWWDPYNQSVLKGDYPIHGNKLFLILSGVSTTTVEQRRAPTPSDVSSDEPISGEFFGQPEQFAASETVQLSFELFHGDSTFKPRDWAIKISPTFSIPNYVNARENGVINIDVRRGTNRTDSQISLEEAFAEVKLADLSPNYDFISVRAGIQPFNSDFRGFLFRDTNLGVRAFGNFGKNRNQWNAAYFDQLEKETNSELNLLERRNQRVFIANFYRQDFLTLGYTISPSVHANFDDGEEFFFDANGFLARPSPIGLIRPHKVHAYYAGLGGDGHWGRLNVTHQFYQAFGTDDFNGVSGQPLDINAQFAAVEFSIDKDWYRPRISFVYASGDADPDDDTAKGFDAISDNPNIAGGPFSFWQRQGLRLPQTAVGLDGRASVLPALRSSKSEGQASFVNPGVLMLNAGVDAELTTKLKLITNINLLRFHRTETLQRLLFQGDIDKAIGIDVGGGFQYRPALNDNMVITAGVSALVPGTGFKQIFADKVLYSPFLVLTLMY